MCIGQSLGLIDLLTCEVIMEMGESMASSLKASYVLSETFCPSAKYVLSFMGSSLP